MLLVKVVGTLGGGPDDQREIRIPNRVVRWEAEGPAYEAHPRHVDIFWQGLSGSDRALAFLGSKPGPAEQEGEEECGSHKAGLCRSCAARANYLSLVRPEMADATMILCRRMRASARHDFRMLRRVARYLSDSPWVMYRFAWQLTQSLRAFVATGFAGCLSMLRGWHPLRRPPRGALGRYPEDVNMEFGESELGSVVEGVGAALGIQALVAEMGAEA